MLLLVTEDSGEAGGVDAASLVIVMQLGDECAEGDAGRSGSREKADDGWLGEMEPELDGVGGESAR